jgi:hypothetical protein
MIKVRIVTKNLAFLIMYFLHHVIKQCAREQLNSSTVSSCGIAANINNSVGGSSSNSSILFPDVCTAVIIFLIYQKL